MADFLTRLAERALGVAPVVQPLLAPRFAPEATAYPPEWDGEGSPTEESAPPLRETLRPRSARSEPTPVPPEYRDGVVPEPERPRNASGSPAEPGHPDEPDAARDEKNTVLRGPSLPSSAPDPSPTKEAPDRASRPPDAPAERDSDPTPSARSSTAARPRRSAQEIVSESNASPDRTDRSSEEPPIRDVPPKGGANTRQRSTRNLSPDTPEHPQRADEILPGSHRSDLFVRVGGEPPEDLPNVPRPAESAARLIELRPGLPTKTLAEDASSSDRPSRNAASEESGLEVASHRSVVPDVSPTATSVAHPGAEVRFEKGRESQPGSPEPSPPTIRVNIGRIEVRAVIPPPAPPRRQVEPPARLSLDDYLKQRSGGRQ